MLEISRRSLLRTQSLMRSAVCIGLALALGSSGAAAAGPADDPEIVQAETSAIEQWQDQNPWGYGTDYLYPLTRDLTGSDMPLWGKIPIYPAAALCGDFHSNNISFSGG